MLIDDTDGGPSAALIAWRRFIVETLVCFELVALIAVLGFRASHNLFVGAVIGTLVVAILRIVRSAGTTSSETRV